MGNNKSSGGVVPIVRPKLININCLQNLYGLSPGETQHLEAFFSEYAGPDRRLDYRSFQRMFRHLNPHLDNCMLTQTAQRAFLDADINGDMMISFDEFVNLYTNYRATYFSHPCKTASLFYADPCCNYN